jgi:uncharacterized iron-regulated membrane protein
MPSVPGSLFRRMLFWSHLGCALVAGIFILLMSVTGVLLTYEHQLVENAAQRNHANATGGARLPLDALARAAREAAPGKARLSLVIDAAATQLSDWQRITLPLERGSARV